MPCHCACVQTAQYPHLSLSENWIEMSLYLMGDMKVALSDHPLNVKKEQQNPQNNQTKDKTAVCL